MSIGPLRCAAWLAVLVVLVLLAPPARPQHRPTRADEILRKAEEIRSPDMDYAVDFVLHAVDPGTTWKEREAEYSLIAHGKDQTLVLMRRPHQFYPGTLLITHGLYWLLLPRAERPFQLSPRHVLNGDISNGDLARGNLVAYYRPSLGGSEKLGDVDAWRLLLTRTRNLGMYKRILCWIAKDDYRPLKFEYFGETDNLLKVAHYEDYRDGPIGVRSMRIVVENTVRPGEHTILTFSNLRRFDASAIDFSREGLPEVRDTILSLAGDEKRQVGLDEMNAALKAAAEGESE